MFGLFGRLVIWRVRRLGASALAITSLGVLLSGTLAAQGQSTSALKPRNTSVPLLAKCHFSPDRDANLPLPIFDSWRWPDFLSAKPVDSAKDADSEEDEDEDGEPEDSDPPTRNFLPSNASGALQRGPCYKVTGGVSSSMTLSDGSNHAGRVPSGTKDRLTKDVRGTLGLQMIEDTDFGRFRAGLELEWSAGSGTSDMALNTLWMSLGAVTVGLKGSGFDFWSGDEFGFKATAPSSTTPLLAIAFRTSENSTFQVSAEDQRARRLGEAGYSGNPLPDVVARWKFDNSERTVHSAIALHDVNLLAPHAIRRLGYAALLGYQQKVSAIGVDDYWTAQFTYADQAPGFLGIAQPGGLLRFTLPRNGPVFLMETMRGWTAALAYSHGYSEKWRSNAFATFVDLKVTEGPFRGRVQVGRAAINLVWTPFDGLDMTWEVGAGRIYRLDTFLGLARYPTRPSFTGQWVIARRF